MMKDVYKHKGKPYVQLGSSSFAIKVQVGRCIYYTSGCQHHIYWSCIVPSICFPIKLALLYLSLTSLRCSGWLVHLNLYNIKNTRLETTYDLPGRGGTYPLQSLAGLRSKNLGHVLPTILVVISIAVKLSGLPGLPPPLLLVSFW